MIKNNNILIILLVALIVLGYIFTISYLIICGTQEAFPIIGFWVRILQTLETCSFIIVGEILYIKMFYDNYHKHSFILFVLQFILGIAIICIHFIITPINMRYVFMEIFDPNIITGLILIVLSIAFFRNVKKHK